MRTAKILLLTTVLCLNAALAVPPGEPFTLGVGESVPVGGYGLVVGFNAILADSRCPMDAFCFWEGDAEAELWADDGREAPLVFSLHTTLYPQSILYGDYEIELLWVAPYPVSWSLPIDPETYEVMLVVLTGLPVGNETSTWGGVKAIYR